jgi:hypothetical protein
MFSLQYYCMISHQLKDFLIQSAQMKGIKKLSRHLSANLISLLNTNLRILSRPDQLQNLSC